MKLSSTYRSGLYFLLVAVAAIALFSLSVLTAEKYAAGDNERVFLEHQALITGSSAQSLQQQLDFLQGRAREVALSLSEVERGPSAGKSRSEELLERARRNFGASVSFIHLDAARSLVSHSSPDNADIMAFEPVWRDWVRRFDINLKPGARAAFMPDFHVTNSRQIAAALFPVPASDLPDAMTRGILIMLVDIAELAERYVAPLRSGEYGAGYLMDEKGRILYDHETEIIGRNIFDGMHADYPDLQRFDNRLLTESAGMDTYHFTRKRSGKVVRKLAAWSVADFGPHKFIITLSAPDSELAAGMTTLRWLSVAFGILLTVIMLVSAWFFVLMRTENLKQSARRLEQKVAAGEEALSETERRMSGFATALPDLGFLFDRDGRYLEIFGDERMLIRPRNQLIGNRFSDLLPEDVANELGAVIEKTLETGRNQFFAYSLNLNDEELHFECKTSRVPGTDRSEPLVALVTRDVTKRLRAEQRLHAAVDSMADGVTLWDPQDRLALFNQQYLEIYPFLSEIPGGLIGKTYEEILRFSLSHVGVQSERARTDFEGWIKKRLEVHRSGDEGAYIAHMEDGRWISVRERSMGEGWIVGIRSDITPMKQAEQTALEARIAAEMASKAKSEFLANMSHELRTPLNAIMGLAEMIQRQELGPVGVPRYVEYAEDIGTSGKHLLTLLNDILNLSRIEIGAMELSEDEIDLSAVVHACQDIAAGLADAKLIELTSRVPQSCRIIGDDRALRQILLNLLSNAIKFTHANGNVAVRLDVTDKIRLSVTDNGIGINKEDLPKVMESFVHLSSPGTAKETGTGIGLSLSRQLAELHQGELLLESELDSGTTATLVLPLELLCGEARVG